MQNLKILCAWKGDDWIALADIVLPVFREYANKWGYKLLIHEGVYGNSGWHFPVQKMAWVRDVVLENSDDYFWVVDLDILITNFNIPVMEFVDSEYHVFMARDITNRPNCGSYIVKNSPEAIQWLTAVCDMRETTTSEQDAIIRLSEMEPTKSITRHLPHGTINQIPYQYYDVIGEHRRDEGNWVPGDLLAHLPGMTPSARTQIFSGLLPEVIR